MIEFIITDKVSFYTKNPLLINKVKNLFTLTNPAFAKKISMGFSVWGVDQYKKYYTNDNNLITIPIGGFPKLLEQEELNNEEIIITDKRVCVSDKEFFDKLVFTGSLREYQQDLVNRVLNSTIGVIKAKTGSGKTISFINLICERKVNTLIIVHLKELLNQTVNAITTFTNLEKSDVGVISGGKANLTPITVALIQSLVSIKKSKKDVYSQIKNSFGQVIGDETHIIAANTYYNIATDLPFKYKYGFSATPVREDGLTDLIHFANGPIIHTVPDKDVADKLIFPKHLTFTSDFYFPYFDSQEYQTMITYMGEDADRNNFIKKVYDENVKGPCCFLCSRVNQVLQLHEKIQDSVVITSKVKTEDREQRMAQLLSGEKKVVITTYQIFSTGLDWPELQYIILCSPIGSYIQLKQLAGRLMRKSAGKLHAYILDIVDPKISVLSKKAEKRKRIFKNL